MSSAVSRTVLACPPAGGQDPNIGRRRRAKWGKPIRPPSSLIRGGKRSEKELAQRMSQWGGLQWDGGRGAARLERRQWRLGGLQWQATARTAVEPLRRDGFRSTNPGLRDRNDLRRGAKEPKKQCGGRRGRLVDAFPIAAVTAGKGGGQF